MNKKVACKGSIKIRQVLFALLLCCAAGFCLCKDFLNAQQTKTASGREIIPLNGEWFCEPTDKDVRPSVWTHTADVPGLVDLIKPEVNWKDKKYFWYKKNINIPSDLKNKFAFLKIGQSQFGTDVWVNGQHAGNNVGCYTSSEFNISGLVRYGGENELIVRVGAKDTLAKESAVGWDPEKLAWLPGIWGDVSLFFTGNLKINYVLVTPKIGEQAADVRVNIKNLTGKTQTASAVSYVKENKSGKVSSDNNANEIVLAPGEEKTVTYLIPIKNMKLWSPESPFLYKLSVSVKNKSQFHDSVEPTFGMREFKIVGPDFYLNGSRIFLKGGNIAFHRFLPDPQRKNLVWDNEWIKKILIDIPKEHNFNFFRNHLGQMYNRWYDMADEYGMLIQDEWAFWDPTGSEGQIKKELSQWLIENYNHPSIIMWDCINEPDPERPAVKMVMERIAPAVKKIDFSRPWEYLDFSEDHPYIYSLGPALINKKFGFTRSPDELKESKTPTLLNEFIWFWLDNNGKPSDFSRSAVDRWMGFNYTNEDCLKYQSFLAAELVEMFRRYRVDGIAPFVYLSAGNGVTANWFLDDIKDLKTKPIMDALKNAYSSFGVSVELWDRHFDCGEKRKINVWVFNDYPHEQKGTLNCSITDDSGKISFTKSLDIILKPSESGVYPVEFVFPKAAGKYYVEAELSSEGNSPANSKKPAFVFGEVKAPEKIKNKRIVVLDPGTEILEFLKTLKLNAVLFNGTKLLQNDVLVVGAGGLTLAEFAGRFGEIDKFVRQGNNIILIEPEFNIAKESRIKLPGNSYLNILKRESKYEGGYDSCIFKTPEFGKSGLWDGIDDEHLRFFNGGFGGAIVNDYEVTADISGCENIKSGIFASSVKAKSGLGLSANVLYELNAGAGLVVVSRVQIRGRLLDKNNNGEIYGLRKDPVAQQYFLNLLNYYCDAENVRKDTAVQLNKFKSNTGKPVASSEQEGYPAGYAADGDMQTRWSSEFSDRQWIIIDLKQRKNIEKIKLFWETACGKEYLILLSNDMENWKIVYNEKNGDGNTDEISIKPQSARYIAVYGIKRGTQWGYSLWEVETR